MLALRQMEQLGCSAHAQRIQEGDKSGTGDLAAMASFVIGVGDILTKCSQAMEWTGSNECKQGPDIFQVVLDRRTGEAPARDGSEIKARFVE